MTEQAACAHIKIQHYTNTEGFLVVREGWRCADCATEFEPSVWKHFQLSELAGRCNAAEAERDALKQDIVTRTIRENKLYDQIDALAAALDALLPESTHEGPCGPEAGCDGNCMARAINPREILASRLAEERKAGAVEAIRQLSNAIRSEPHPNHLLFAAIAEGFAKQIERGEAKP